MTWKNSPLDDLAWIVADGLTAYPEALAFMEARVAEIHAGTAPETVWLVEHPPLYTAGTSAKADDLVAPERFPVFEAGRGGQYTYHGPGQRVAYAMLDLKQRGGDVRAYVTHLEEWIIRTLARFNVKGERREGRIGIWVDRGPDGRGGRREDKIGALGVRVRRGGHVPRHLAQRRLRPFAFRRHRAVRHLDAGLRRDLACRPRADRLDGGSRHGA